MGLYEQVIPAKEVIIGDARTHLEKSIELNPDYSDAHFHLALLLKDQGELKKARKHLQKAVELDENHVEGHYHLALLFHEEQDYEKARTYYLRTI